MRQLVNSITTIALLEALDKLLNSILSSHPKAAKLEQLDIDRAA